MTKIIEIIMLKMKENNVIEDEENAICRYGLELLIEKTFIYFLLIFIGFLSKKFVYSIFFLSGYSILRKCSGGWHSKERLGCCLYTGADFLTVIVAPVDCNNKILNIEQIKYYKERMLFVIALVNVKNIVQTYGGTIFVESDNSNFNVYINLLSEKV